MNSKDQQSDETSDSVGDPFAEMRALLAYAGIRPPDDDLGSLARLHPGLLRRVERMHSIDTGDEVQAAVFRADEHSAGGC
jgi:hypothetical protein